MPAPPLSPSDNSTPIASAALSKAYINNNDNDDDYNFLLQYSEWRILCIHQGK
jgi:hypothetical protein